MSVLHICQSPGDVEFDLQKGPRSASGSPAKLRLKETPTPFGAVEAVMYPRTSDVSLSGRVALYTAPAGFPETAIASPSLPVVPGMTGPSYEASPSMMTAFEGVGAGGFCALTSAKPESAAAMIP